MEILRVENLKKTYGKGNTLVKALDDVNFTVDEGERVAIVGASGSGKSTLLHLLGGLDQPTTGVVQLLDQNLSTLNEVEKGKLRNQKLGFVYQFHHLLPEFSALENVAMPLLIRRMKRIEAEHMA